MAIVRDYHYEITRNDEQTAYVLYTYDQGDLVARTEINLFTNDGTEKTQQELRAEIEAFWPAVKASWEKTELPDPTNVVPIVGVPYNVDPTAAPPLEEEAPMTGEYYGRVVTPNALGESNEAGIQHDTGIPDAPETGDLYARRLAQWQAFQPFVDAQQDGEYYTRRNGSWSAVSNIQSASDVTNTPSGEITATDVQSALNELDTEKLSDAVLDGKTYGRKDGAWSEIATSGGSSNIVTWNHDTVRCEAERGLPTTQGWSVTQSNGVSIRSDEYKGKTVDTLRLYDPSSSGLDYNDMYSNLSAAQFQNLYNYGGSVRLSARMVDIYYNGFTSYVQVSAADNPLGTGELRLGFSMRTSSSNDSYPTVAIHGGSSIALRNIATHDYHDFDIVIKPNLADAELYIDGEFVSNMSFSSYTGAHVGSRMVIYTGSYRYMVYVRDFELTILNESTSKTIPTAFFSNSTSIVTPRGKTDYQVILPDNASPQDGHELALFAQNDSAITLSQSAENILFDGFSSTSLMALKPQSYEWIFTDGTYVTTSSSPVVENSYVMWNHTDYRFFAERGEGSDGWKTGDGAMDIRQDTIDGLTENILYVRNSSALSNKSLYHDIEQSDVTGLDSNGGEITTDMKVSSSNSHLIALTVNASDNPLGTGTKRLGFYLRKDPSTDMLSVQIYSGSTYVVPNTRYDEYNRVSLDISNSLATGNADLYVNDILIASVTGVWSDYSGSYDQTRLMSLCVGYPAYGYIRNFGMTFLKENASKTLSVKELNAKNVMITTPNGHKNYSIIAPVTIQPSNAGKRLVLNAKNVGGTISFAPSINEQLNAITLNGKSNITVPVEERREYILINAADNSNDFISVGDLPRVKRADDVLYLSPNQRIGVFDEEIYRVKWSGSKANDDLITSRAAVRVVDGYIEYQDTGGTMTMFNHGQYSTNEPCYYVDTATKELRVKVPAAYQTASGYVDFVKG